MRYDYTTTNGTQSVRPLIYIWAVLIFMIGYIGSQIYNKVESKIWPPAKAVVVAEIFLDQGVGVVSGTSDPQEGPGVATFELSEGFSFMLRDYREFVVWTGDGPAPEWCKMTCTEDFVLNGLTGKVREFRTKTGLSTRQLHLGPVKKEDKK